MNAQPDSREFTTAIVTRSTFLGDAKAWFSLSQTQRWLAHRYRREAFDWEAKGNHANFSTCMAESRRLWREAKWHLRQARLDLKRAHR